MMSRKVDMKTKNRVPDDTTLMIELHTAEPIGDNLAMGRVGHYMVFVVDLNENLGETESGRSLAIASSHRFRLLEKDTRISLLR